MQHSWIVVALILRTYGYKNGGGDVEGVGRNMVQVPVVDVVREKTAPAIGLAPGRRDDAHRPRRLLEGE